MSDEDQAMEDAVTVQVLTDELRGAERREDRLLAAVRRLRDARRAARFDLKDQRDVEAACEDLEALL